MHDGIGVGLAARRLNRGKFVWVQALNGLRMVLDGKQWQALVLGLPLAARVCGRCHLCAVAPCNRARRQYRRYAPCGILAGMSIASLDHLDTRKLRALAELLMGRTAVRDEQLATRDARIAKHDQVLHFKDTHIEQLNQELALYKRWRYGKRSEQLNPGQASLLEDAMDAATSPPS